jgi:putative flippase GtrA
MPLLERYADILAGMSGSSATTREQRPHRRLLPTAMRYLGGSVVATVCSEAVFIAMYGPLGTGTTWASIVAWLAGALPNYWLNRAWAWKRTGRPGFRDEILPYATIILLTLCLAIVMTKVAAHELTAHGIGSSLRVGTVAVVFEGVYVVMFVVRFFLLDRLFARLAHRDAEGAA